MFDAVARVASSKLRSWSAAHRCLSLKKCRVVTVEPQVTAALIALAGSVGVPVAGWIGAVWGRTRTQRRLGRTSNAAWRPIAGTWQGETVQYATSAIEKRVELRAELQQKRRRVSRTGHVAWQPDGNPPSQMLAVDFWGAFVTDSVVLLSYRAKEAHILNYGEALLSIDGTGKVLTGGVVGFGSDQGRLVAPGRNLARFGVPR
jgi:hypothetical protein